MHVLGCQGMLPLGRVFAFSNEVGWLHIGAHTWIIVLYILLETII